MKNILLFAVCALFMGSNAFAHDITDLKFLSGCWSGQLDNSVAKLEAYYSEPKAQMLFAHNQVLDSGNTLGWGSSAFQMDKTGKVTLLQMENGMVEGHYSMISSSHQAGVDRAEFLSDQSVEGGVIYTVRDGAFLSIAVHEIQNGTPVAFELHLRRDDLMSECRR